MTTVALIRVFRLVNGGTPTSDEGNWGGDVQWATPVDLARHNGGRIASTDRTLTPEGLASGSRAVHAGSLIVSTRAPIGYVAETSAPMAFNQGCRGLEPKLPVDIRYFRYQLGSMTELLQSFGNGSTFVELSSDALAEAPVVVPSLAEQRAIADYLDAETARIDALIAKKRQLIHLLDERLQCASDDIIDGLLQRGDLVPLKYVVRESDRRLGAGREAEVLSVSIHHGVVPRSDIDDRESRADDLSFYKLCMPGEIVLNRMRAFQGGVGVARHEGIVSPDYTVMVPTKHLLPDFLHFLMRSQWFVGEMVRRLRGIGSTDQGAVRTPRVNYADLGLIEIPVPTIDEQQHLAGALHRSTQRAATTRDLLRRQLELVLEHRQALITAAVAPGVQLAN